MFAVMFGRQAMVELLLEAGADPQRRDVEGYSAIDLAAGQADPAIFGSAQPRPQRLRGDVPYALLEFRPGRCTMARNSALVAGLVRNAPSMRLVIRLVPGLCTPRVVMH